MWLVWGALLSGLDGEVAGRVGCEEQNILPLVQVVTDWTRDRTSHLS